MTESSPDEKIGPVSRVDQERIRRLLAHADRLRGRRRGDALESAVKELLRAVPGLELVASDRKDEAGAEELDLGYLNHRPQDGLIAFGPEILVECKNWEKPVGAPEVGWFIHKLRSAQQQVGILVAAQGVTGDPIRRNAAHHEINMARAATPSPVNVVVLTRAELESIPDSDALIKVLNRKLFHVRTGGLLREFTPQDLAPDGFASGRAERAAQTALTSEFADVDPANTRQPSESTGSPPFDAGTWDARAFAPTLVSNLAWRQLSHRCNSLLVGPRGSGKTALLRGLAQRPAEEIAAQGAGFDVPAFTGVYVDASRSPWWSLREDSNPYGDEAVIGVAMFTCMALQHMAEALDHRLRQLASEHQRNEAQKRVVDCISDLQDLQPRPASLSEVAAGLAVRRLHWERILRSKDRRGDDGNRSRSVLGGAQLESDLHFALRHVISVANGAMDDPDHQWCLVVDGAEMVGRALVETLLEMMRNTDDRLLIKFALGPAAASNWIRGSTAAESGRDYEFVSLPPVDSHTWGAKVATLVAVRSGRADSGLGGGGQPGPPLASSGLATDSVSRARALAAKDDTFRDWAAQRGLFDDELGPAQVALVRKAAWNITLRDYFFGPGGRKRSRMALEPWTTDDALLLLLSEEPRLLKAYIIRFADRVAEGQPTNSRSLRGVVLQEVLDQYYLSYLANLGGGRPLKLLDRIGWALRERYYGAFSLDTPLAFTVDAGVSEKHRDSLSLALEVGALVPSMRPVGPESWGVDHGPLRLGWPLMLRYRLPLQRGRAVAMSSLIAAGRPSDT